MTLSQLVSYFTLYLAEHPEQANYEVRQYYDGGGPIHVVVGSVADVCTDSSCYDHDAHQHPVIYLQEERYQ